MIKISSISSSNSGWSMGVWSTGPDSIEMGTRRPKTNSGLHIQQTYFSCNQLCTDYNTFWTYQTTDFHTYKSLRLFPEAVFGCSNGLSAGCSTVRVRGHWSAGSRDGPGNGQEELNVNVGQTDVQSRKLNLPKKKKSHSQLKFTIHVKDNLVGMWSINHMKTITLCPLGFVKSKKITRATSSGSLSLTLGTSIENVCYPQLVVIFSCVWWIKYVTASINPAAHNMYWMCNGNHIYVSVARLKLLCVKGRWQPAQCFPNSV